MRYIIFYRGLRLNIQLQILHFPNFLSFFLRGGGFPRIFVKEEPKLKNK